MMIFNCSLFSQNDETLRIRVIDKIVPLSEVIYVYYNIPAQDTVMAKISVNALRTTINR